MPALDRIAAVAALLSGAMLLADVIVIAVLNDSWGTFDNLLWSGAVLLAPVALVPASVALTRGRRHRWLMASAVLAALLAVMVGLGYLFQAIVDSWYGGANLGLVWEAPNWAFALVLLSLGLLVLRRAQKPVRTTPAS